MHSTYTASTLDFNDRKWAIPREAAMNLEAVHNIFGHFFNGDVLLVSMHGGPHLTHMAMVSLL